MAAVEYAAPCVNRRFDGCGGHWGLPSLLLFMVTIKIDLCSVVLMEDTLESSEL